MKLDWTTVEKFAIIGLDGGAVLFPAAAIPIAAVEALVAGLEESGVVGQEASAEQLAAIAAGMAASRASAVTTDRARRKS